MSILRQAARVAGKDLRIELRSREIVYTMAFFGGLLVVIYTFAFPRDEAAVRGSLPGMLWVTIAFTGTIGLGRAFDRERENDTMRALLLTPVPRLAVFLGKAISIVLLVLAVTAGLLAGNTQKVWYWMGFLGIFDGVFLVVSLWIFESMVIE